MPKPIKYHIRRRLGPIIQLLAYFSGIMRLTAGRNGADGAVILMYHSVADTETAQFIDPANHVPAAVFTAQMRFLAKRRHVIRLDELVAELRQQRPPTPGAVVITFDDGYLDNLTVAAPILARYQLPATIFLPPAYIERAESQWIDQAYCAFKFRSRSSLSWPKNSSLITFNLNTPQEIQRAYQAVCAELMRVTGEKRRQLLDNLWEALRPQCSPPRLTLRWDEIPKLQAAGFDIGAHTLEHSDLRQMSLPEARTEVAHCIQKIKTALGERPQHFSFPYGRTSAQLRQLVAEMGFLSACGGDGLGPVLTPPADPFRLPRIPAPPAMRYFFLLTTPINRGRWRRLGP